VAIRSHLLCISDRRASPQGCRLPDVAGKVFPRPFDGPATARRVRVKAPRPDRTFLPAQVGRHATAALQAPRSRIRTRDVDVWSE